MGKTAVITRLVAESKCSCSRVFTLSKRTPSKLSPIQVLTIVVRKLSGELPFYSWSEDAIRDAVEQFILDHSRVPTATDFKKRGLPPHTVIMKRFGITLQEWLKRDYPVVKPSEDEKRTEATEAFVRDYFRIQPKSADEFSARRMPGTHCWYTVAVCNHTRNWRNLLTNLELPVYNNVDVPRIKPDLKVSVISDTDFRD